MIANFPFSDDHWWLPEEQRTDEQVKKAKKEFGKAGFKDKYGRFKFGQPPASYGDFAFIQHIISSANQRGRCGVVCPQGVLFRGQPEIEEETGDFDADGNPKVRRRKADDEYLIRKGMLDARLIDAVIALPLNVFYGAGVPACLLILNKHRPAERRDKLLLVYAARHYRELSNKNQLRPQDVMRILVHYHAYGDAGKAAALVLHHGKRLQTVINREETEEVGRITAEYQNQAEKLAGLEAVLAETQRALERATNKVERKTVERSIAKLQAAKEKPLRELARRDEQISEIHKRAEEERHAIQTVGEELTAMYREPAELAKHARVVDFVEIEENEFSLNIPRYVDTFEPEAPIDVSQALADLEHAEEARQEAERRLKRTLKEAGYG